MPYFWGSRSQVHNKNNRRNPRGTRRILRQLKLMYMILSDEERQVLTSERHLNRRQPSSRGSICPTSPDNAGTLIFHTTLEGRRYPEILATIALATMSTRR